MNDVRYFALAPGEMEPRGLLRITETDTTYGIERFDHQKKDWVDYPQGIDQLMGEDVDAEEISPSEATALAAKLAK